MSETFTVEVPGAVTAGAVAEKITLPFSGSIDQIALSAGTAPSSVLTVDALVNGVSIFKTVGKVAGTDSTGANTATSGISATDTRIGITVDGSLAQEGILNGADLLIGSEVVTVTKVEGSNSQQGAGSTVQSAGGVESSSSSYTLACTVTRGARGTTAAVHAHGDAVTAAKPILGIGATSTGVKPGLTEPVEFANGDVLTFSTSGGTGLGDLTITADVSRV